MATKDFINKIICGDCIEGMKLLEDNSVDLVVTSPPYNCGIKYDEWNDDLPEEQYYNQMKKIIKEIKRILKKDGRVCWNVADLYYNKSQNKENISRSSDFIKIFESFGFKIWRDIIWHQTDNNKLTAWGSWKSASSPFIFCDYEHVLIFFKESWDKLNKGISDITKDEFISSCKSSVWRITPVVTKKIEGDCPVPFPIKLIRRLIKLFSYQNDLILDPFCGRGTSCIVSKQNNRNFIGFEVSKKYYELANKRLEQENLNKF